MIAHGSDPVVRLVAIKSPKGERKPGALKGKIRLGPEFFEPLPQDELVDGSNGACALAQVENRVIVSNDFQLDGYGVRRIW